MRNLLNRKNKEKLIEDLKTEKFDRITCSFYRYINISEPEVLRDELYIKLSKHKILGRIYIAKEGINAQVSVQKPKWKKFIEILDTFDALRDLRLNPAIKHSNYSFIKLIIKVKHKIVADGLKDDDIDLKKTGKHLSAKEFNEAMDDTNSVIIDIRNYYESEVGHFQKAICPEAETFRELLPVVKNMLKDSKNKKILMYCTGGIRCEKASSYLIKNNFKDVNQLEGGIISYKHQVENQNLECKFKGKNFVFDSRMGENVTSEIISQCHQCSNPSNHHTNCNNQACHILFIQCKSCQNKFMGCCSRECTEIASLPIEEQKLLRKELSKAAPLKKFAKGTKPRLKEIIKNKSRSI
tara:strand:+ start:532 stop:1590 length:1059 start_codon:yes stop_codon:yes gene_type:complete